MPSHRNSKPALLVLYHYMYPDDVVSARHFDGFCQELVERGWTVEAWPCNRGCRSESTKYPLDSHWNGIRFRRVWRPAFRQSSAAGRLLNSLWMVAVWTWRLLVARNQPSVVVVGTDPPFSVLAALLPHRLRGIPMVHWCYDLYPEGAVAEGMFPASGAGAALVRRLLGAAYRSCRWIVDLGPCMRAQLARYRHGRPASTLVPWALVEPAAPLAADPAIRAGLFGRTDCLALLYSGTFGRAHSYESLLALARELQPDGVRVCFSVRGNREPELRRALAGSGLSSIRMAPFADESALMDRLGAADIHCVSLQESWTGVVVPSKFFGALAAGRPVLFAGSPESAIARWISEFGVGWTLTPESLSGVAGQLRLLSTDRSRLRELQRHCHLVYRNHFSKGKTMDRWDSLLRGAAGAPVKTTQLRGTPEFAEQTHVVDGALQ